MEDREVLLAVGRIGREKQKGPPCAKGGQGDQARATYSCDSFKERLQLDQRRQQDERGENGEEPGSIEIQQGLAEVEQGCPAEKQDQPGSDRPQPLGGRMPATMRPSRGST